MTDRELLHLCKHAFVGLTSATGSAHQLTLMGLKRQHGMTPQEDLADQMVKILHVALGGEK